MKPDAVMIFAAGFGTRMMPLTKDRAKPMVHVNGAPMIDRAIAWAKDAGAQRLVANTHYKPALLETHLLANDVTPIREEPDILDTGGGLKNASSLLGHDPAWTINPDAIWLGPNPLGVIAENWRPDEMDALLLCVLPDQAHGTDNDGDFLMDPKGRLTWGKGGIYGGVQIIKMGLLDSYAPGNFSLHPVWNDCMDRGRLFGCTYPGAWCDIGHPGGIGLAETLMEQDQC